MKNLFLFIFFIPLLSVAQMDEEMLATKVDWHTDYNKAMNKARKQNKNVLIYFTGSDWCGPCIALKKDLFETEEFQELSESYILLYIDIPRRLDIISEVQMKHNKGMLPKYNKKGVFPLFKVLNSKGKELDKLSGYSMNGETRYHLNLLRENM